MPIVVAVGLLALVVVTAGMSRRLAASRPTIFFALPFLVLLGVRGSEPTLTYVRIAAFTVSMAMLATRLAAVRAEALSRVRVELVMCVTLAAAILASEFLVPNTSAAQRPLLNSIIGLTAVLVVTVFARFGIAVVRGVRQKANTV